DFAYNVGRTAAEIVQDTKDSLKKTIYIENRVNSLSFSAVEEMILDANRMLKASFKLPPERHDSFTTRRYSCPPPLKNRQQCPLCRGPCPRSAEAWDLVGPPDDLECRREMSLVLLNLIYNAGISSHPGH
ncbi:hypothetical protein TSMEX_011745, partial [Taenia solium]